MDNPRSREEVLAAVRKVVGDSHEKGNVKGRMVFCPICGVDITKGNNKPGQKVITCSNSQCNYNGNRALIFDDKIVWEFNDGDYQDIPNGELIHFSVGTIIERKSRFLLFRRTLHPVGKFTIPAGHLEQGEKPELAAIKEAYEETGLGILSATLEKDIVIQEPCRRSVEFHVWKLFTCDAIGEPKMSYEADIIGWYSHDEIKNLPLTIPTRMFFDLD